MIDLDAARALIHGHARLIDRRRFQHALDGAPADLVLAAVLGYRNPDRGIGALEPDPRTPADLPIPTSCALEILNELPPPTRAERWRSAHWTGWRP